MGSWQKIAKKILAKGAKQKNEGCMKFSRRYSLLRQYVQYQQTIFKRIDANEYCSQFSLYFLNSYSVYKSVETSSLDAIVIIHILHVCMSEHIVCHNELGVTTMEVLQ